MRQRAKIVKHYRAHRRTADSEHEAAEAVAQRFNCDKSRLRRYHRLWCEGGKRALMPRYRYRQKAPRARLTLSGAATQLALALRQRLDWCGQRIAEELRERGLADVSHTTIYRLFRRYHVPLRCYHPLGKGDGIRYGKQGVKALIAVEAVSLEGFAMGWCSSVSYGEPRGTRRLPAQVGRA